MKLLELSLYNYCIYRGEQTFDLSPTKRNGKHRPVVLIGGINGGGKTTVFDAILLALYGPLANCSKRSNLGYHDFLRSCIHRGIDPSDGASVSLSFEYVAEGVERVYEVKRVWLETNGRIKETLVVYKDGEKDTWLSKDWNQVVEEIIPLGISQLFFFDAEKIRFIADDDSTSEALGVAIKSLLGLDLVERLIADSKVIEMRLAEQTVSKKDLEVLDELKERISVATAEVASFKQDRSSVQNDLDKSKLQFAQAEKSFAHGGGEHWEKREQTRSESQSLDAQRLVTKASLQEMAHGSLPLTLLSNLLSDVQLADDVEQSVARSKVVGSAIEEYNTRVLKQLKKKKIESKFIKLLQEIQNAELPRSDTTKIESLDLKLSERARGQLNQLLDHSHCQQVEKARELLDFYDDVQSKMDTVKRSLAATPQDSEIKVLASDFKERAKQLGKFEQMANILDQEIDERKRGCEILQKQLENMLLKDDAENVKATDSARMSQLAARTRKTMHEFLKQSTASKIDRLAEYIYESFQYLLRKKSLVKSIDIDPESFAITLQGKDGISIPKQHLSEGEKQIFAISVLWGLARASNRRLPTIIDTPMGRLDSAHRDNLLKKYFPNASHQTIILSTDTEVDERYFDLLEPSIARAYSLKYNERKRETHVEEGYFWNPELVGAKQ